MALKGSIGGVFNGINVTVVQRKNVAALMSLKR